MSWNCVFCKVSLLSQGSLCKPCFEQGKTIINLTNEHCDQPNNNSANCDQPNNNSANSTKGFAKALKWMKEMNEKLTYLSGFAAAFREQLHTDIQLKSGNNEPSIPAHSALLAVRSCIFRNMMDSYKCKAPPGQIITLPELNHKELRSLLEFLYTGSLPKEKLKKHVCSLLIAAAKYEIPFLQKFCQDYLLESLNSANALDILEISDTCYSGNENLQETILNFIQGNWDAVISSKQFDVFAVKNPHLTVRITRWSGSAVKKPKTDV